MQSILDESWSLSVCLILSQLDHLQHETGEPYIRDDVTCTEVWWCHHCFNACTAIMCNTQFHQVLDFFLVSTEFLLSKLLTTSFLKMWKLYHLSLKQCFVVNPQIYPQTIEMVTVLPAVGEISDVEMEKLLPFTPSNTETCRIPFLTSVWQLEGSSSHWQDGDHLLDCGARGVWCTQSGWLEWRQNVEWTSQGLEMNGQEWIRFLIADWREDFFWSWKRSVKCHWDDPPSTASRETICSAVSTFSGRIRTTRKQLSPLHVS